MIESLEFYVENFELNPLKNSESAVEEGGSTGYLRVLGLGFDCELLYLLVTSGKPHPFSKH